MFFTKFYQKVWTFPDFISEPLCGIFGPLIQTGLTQGTRVECFIFLLCFINLLIISRYNDHRYDLEDKLVSWYFTTDSGKAGSAVALNVILPQRGKNVEDDVFLKTSSSTTTLSVSYSQIRKHHSVLQEVSCAHGPRSTQLVQYIRLSQDPVFALEHTVRNVAATFSPISLVSYPGDTVQCVIKPGTETIGEN